MAIEIIQELTGIDTPTLANAIEKLHVRNRTAGFAHRLMRQLTQEMGVMCGYAVTVKAVTATPDPSGRGQCVDRYIEVCKAVRSALKPAVVVFQEFGNA